MQQMQPQHDGEGTLTPYDSKLHAGLMQERIASSKRFVMRPCPPTLQELRHTLHQEFVGNGRCERHLAGLLECLREEDDGIATEPVKGLRFGATSSADQAPQQVDKHSIPVVFKATHILLPAADDASSPPTPLKLESGSDVVHVTGSCIVPREQAQPTTTFMADQSKWNQLCTAFEGDRGVIMNSHTNPFIMQNPLYER